MSTPFTPVDSQSKTLTDTPKTGKLKIFFGYATGVGKTYAMLNAAHRMHQAQHDIVIGYIEKHTHPDTLALMNGLEQISVRKTSYQSITLSEFDLDAALERKPEIILVDELAHSNAPTSRHKKRYQDIEELLAAGINVYTTVNVQHLESLNDLVASITHISVSERVPDYIFDSADAVELVDIEPVDLITRLQTGKVYQKHQAKRALGHFFTQDNLEALREIALRRTADRLSRKAALSGNVTTSKAEEHILICLSESASNAKAIRTAARMADAFHSGFTALFVETSRVKNFRDEQLKQLRNNLTLAEQLGAHITTLYGEDPSVQIAEYAKISGITKIVLGRTNHPQQFAIRKKSLADKLTKLAGNIDIYIIPDAQKHAPTKSSYMPHNALSFKWTDFFKAIGIVTLATIIGIVFDYAGLREANIIMVYILGVLLTAIWTKGHFYGVFASILSVVVFNFFFTIPRFTLAAYGPDYPITFVVMLAASLISSTLATRVKKQAHQSTQRAYYMELLMNSSKRLQSGKDEHEIMRLAAEQVRFAIGRPVLYALAQQDEPLTFSAVPADQGEHVLQGLNTEEIGVANWVLKNNKSAGATTSTLSNAQNLYMAVQGTQDVMGVIAIPSKFYPSLGVFEKNLTTSILDECGVLVERCHLRNEAQRIELEKQQEQLRSNLLRGISHDLRTPLTSISGNAGMLMESNIHLGVDKKFEIYRDIYDDANWLINLTENLLSITRIDNGNVKLTFSPELIDEVIDEGLSHIDRRACEHTITKHITDDLLMAKMDVHLVVQVIINIVNNAIKYTQPGSTIDVSANQDGEFVRINITDDGPGIPDSAKIHLFDLFYTTGQGGADSRRGLGIGLSLCKLIIDSHGGTITAKNNTPHGTIFSFTLPIEKVIIDNVQA